MQNESGHDVVRCAIDRRDPADTVMKTTMPDFAPAMLLAESVDIPSVSAILDIRLAQHHVDFVSSHMKGTMHRLASAPHQAKTPHSDFKAATDRRNTAADDMRSTPTSLAFAHLPQ